MGALDRFAVFALGALAAFGCSSRYRPRGGREADAAGCVSDNIPARQPFDVKLVVIDEQGVPVSGAVLDLGKEPTHVSQSDGSVRLSGLTSPVLAIVSAPGFLAEPVPLGRGDGRVEGPVSVRLLSDKGGKRIAVHSAGDVMFGRRYENPVEGEPLIPEAAVPDGARHVVASVRRVFAASDVRTFNLETVVADLPDDAKYPGKRFILRSPPGTLAGVAALQASVVGLANNHSRDYLDRGIVETVNALNGAGIPFTGASASDGEAPPFVVNARGARVGVLTWTTVEGSFVNDSYPPEDKPRPAGAPASEAWQYEQRPWSYRGISFEVPLAERRIRTGWEIFRTAEPGMTTTDQAGSWTSLATAYPEMQDWVARRGHGGAALWRGPTGTAAIRKLASEVDLVIVQFHAGYQFQEAPSVNVQAIARASIDAGADLVVCHHPHVLQGFEWYKGHLIAYSLGNFVFDQDFLSTFSSTILRTVWEGKTLVEARAIPVELEAYRPMPAVDRAARLNTFRLWERSVMRAESDRNSIGVRAAVAEPVGDSRLAHLTFEHNTGRIVSQAPQPRTIELQVSAGTVVPIAFDGLIDPRLGLTGADGGSIYVGRDVFGWGRFEDELADETVNGGAHWAVNECNKAIVRGDAAEGVGFLRMRRSASSTTQIVARPVARIPLSRHRIHAAIDSAAPPLDPQPRYSVRFKARMEGSVPASLRLELYRFDDNNPTEDPDSERIEKLELPFTPESGRGWQPFELTIDPEKLGSSQSAGNMVLLYVQLKPGEAILDIDDIQFMEWRPAASMHDRFGFYDSVKNDGTAPRTLHIVGLPATP